MSDIRLGTTSGDPSLLDGCQGVLGELIDGVNLLSPGGMGSSMMYARSLVATALTTTEAARVGTGETIRESNGVELRDLLGWLVPAGDPAIEVRWTLRALTIRVPVRPAAAGRAPLDLLQHHEADVVVAMPAVAGAPAELLSATVVLDENTGWILADIHFGTPEAPNRDQAMRVMEALKTSALTVTFSVKHSWRTAQASEGPTLVLPKFEWILSREALNLARDPAVLKAVLAVTPATPPATSAADPSTTTLRTAMATAVPVTAARMATRTGVLATASVARRTKRLGVLRTAATPTATLVRAVPTIRVEDLTVLQPADPPAEDPTNERVVTAKYALSVAQSDWDDVFADLDQGDRWRPTTVGVGGRSLALWYRPADNKIGEYFYLPSVYRIGFLPVNGLPAVRSRLVASEAGFRVQLGVAAVPVVDPEEREALRNWLSADRGLPYVSLQFPRGVEAKLIAAAVGDAGTLVLGEGVPVDSERGFLLDLDVPADRYDVVCAVLRSAMGIHGQVRFSAPDGEAPTVNVALSVDAVAPRPLAVTLAFGMVLELKNVTTMSVELGGLSAWWVQSGTSGIHDGVEAPLLRMVGDEAVPYDGVTPLRFAPGESITISMSTRPSETWKARVELGATRLLDADPSAWLDQINRQEAAPAATRLDVEVVGLDAPELAAAGFLSMELRLLDAAGTLVASSAVTPSANRWGTEVQRALVDWAGGNGGLAGLALEARAVFPDPGLGLVQRFVFAAGDTTLSLRAPGVETLTSDYEVTEIVKGDAQPPQTLPRGAVNAVLDGLRARNSGWRLRVVAPVVPVVTPDPVVAPEPVVTPDPVVTPEPVTPSPTVGVQIVPTLLDFEADLKLAIVQVSWIDPATGVPASQVVQFGKALGNTVTVATVAVPVRVGAALVYDLVAELIAVDPSRSTRVTRTGIGDTLVLLERPAGS